MIVVLEDDGCLHRYASLEAVVRHIEALDAEECLRAVFDDDGQRYRIEWIEPNRKGIGVRNGIYRLVPEGAPDRAALTVMLREHSFLILT
ncbi:MAG TPA: hypothetical protein VHB97_07765 [Polyangia bacterium]|jgi:hypothetical protein|nr:hypothetical protein [Polyangia bacterium]